MTRRERRHGSRSRDPDGSPRGGGPAPASRSARVTTGGDVTVVSPCGELDVLTAEPLRRDLARVVEASDADVVVDLAEVTFIDAAALGVLVGARNRLEATGRHLRLVVAGERVLRVFRISGLSDLFEIHRALPDALDADPRP